MKTAAGICWYMDHLITRTLDSIQGHFDYIFVIDGKFSLNPAKNDYSDEELREKVRKYPNVILIDYIGNEEDKRDQYLLACKKHNVDVLLIIDSDEYIDKNTDWNLFWSQVEKKREGIFDVLVLPNEIWLPRIWVNPSDWRYYGAHCIFQQISTGFIASSANSSIGKLEGLILQLGKDVPRTQEYYTNTRIYQERMIEKEKPIRKQINP